MRFNFHDYYCPAHDVVFSIMFAKSLLFCRLVSAVTGDAIEIEGEVYSQAVMRENNVLLNSIRFDTFAKTKNNKFYTLDMQRKYKKVRQERRTVYYACRAISKQEVEKMAYEKLNPVNISFILTEHDEKQAIRIIKLCDIKTHELYDDLIELTIVNVPTALRKINKTSDLYLFASFFAISNQAEANKFTKKFEMTKLGKELIVMYNTAVANAQNLKDIENSPYFTERLSEADIEEARQEAKLEGIIEGKKTQALNTARIMLKLGCSHDMISQYVGLDIETILKEISL